ncbi:hypothetical protein EZV62_000165 [Acer yangbiense]|uniref:Zinc knuckle CX2CX4HX4C domain-containing protein n=1 Tax=Acer yangbiense TaxID=1000413 RepID=A0A5C7IT23_9ROSI|nr:hypothetical protein EZV62_000165 [Acer yangbiense]
MDKVISGSPWSFDNALMVLEKPVGMGTIESLKFSQAEFWVQIYKIPILCMTKEIGRFLGGMIGEVLDIDGGNSGDCVGKFMRVRIRMDITKSLKRCLRVDIMGDGTETIMILRHERLPNHCFKCGMVDHSTSECSEEGQRGPFFPPAKIGPNWKVDKGIVEGNLMTLARIEIPMALKVSDTMDDIIDRVRPSMTEPDYSQKQGTIDGDRGRVVKEDVMVQESGSQSVICSSHQQEKEGNLAKSNKTEGAAINGEMIVESDINCGMGHCDIESIFHTISHEMHRPVERFKVESHVIPTRAKHVCLHPSTTNGLVLGSEAVGPPGNIPYVNNFAVSPSLLNGSVIKGSRGTSVFHRRIRGENLGFSEDSLEVCCRKKKSDLVVNEGCSGGKRAKTVDGILDSGVDIYGLSRNDGQSGFKDGSEYDSAAEVTTSMAQKAVMAMVYLTSELIKLSKNLQQQTSDIMLKIDITCLGLKLRINIQDRILKDANGDIGDHLCNNIHTFNELHSFEKSYA